MPTASVARPEKQASTDANDPLRQGLVIIAHKIRNLEKRKAKLESYREGQKNGKTLNRTQLNAISKYDEVLAQVGFARELNTQLETLSKEFIKESKKQASTMAKDRAQQELTRIKELLVIQDVLTGMGQDVVREDFLGGKAKVSLTPEELQSIDDLYMELTPKRDEPAPTFMELFDRPAETMLRLIQGKNKKVFGSTYSALKAKLLEIATSGYFDPPAPPVELVEPEPDPVESAEDTQRRMPDPTPQHSYPQNNAVPHPAEVDHSIVTVIPSVQSASEVLPKSQSIETAFFTPSHLRVFKSGTIDFMQENELDTPEASESSASSAIPTMTFANQSFSAPNMEPPVPQPHHIDPPQQFKNQTDEEKGWSTTGPLEIANETVVAPPPQQLPIVNSWGAPPPAEPVPPVNSGGGGDDDWASQTEQWHQNQPNDGFIPAGSGRGGRSRGGGGGDRNRGSGGYQNRGRGGSGRGGYRDNRDRDRERDNYFKDHSNGGYQNGYQSGGGPRGGRGGPRQGGRGNGGGSRGSREGFRGGNSGGYRGGNSGNYSRGTQ